MPSTSYHPRIITGYFFLFVKEITRRILSIHTPENKLKLQTSHGAITFFFLTRPMAICSSQTDAHEVASSGCNLYHTTHKVKSVWRVPFCQGQKKGLI